jgi:hypothetical protein
LRLDEVDHRDAGGLVDIADLGGNPRLRCDAHGQILMRIAQRTRLTLHPQHKTPAADLDPEDRRARSSAHNRRDRADRSGAKGGSERRARGLTVRGWQCVETV